MGRPQTKQAALFVAPDYTYGWRSVQQVAKHALIVIAGQEVKVLGVRQEGNDWYLSYQDIGGGQKGEQLYNAHDSVYVKQRTK